MANFLIIHDPDAERRLRFLGAAQERIALLPNLVLERCDSGDLGAVAARGAGTPYSAWREGAETAWLFGDAFAAQPEACHARDLAERWTDNVVHTGTFDGYFAGFTYSPADGLTIGVDLAGIFPLYYWQRDDVLLAGSSPELFRLHPQFDMRLSPAGLAGILLINGLVDNQALLEGVRRLKAGHLLRYTPQGGVRETPHRPLAVSDRFNACSHGELLEIADAAFDRALRRHATPGPKALLLSGGLDSRIVAGYLRRLGQTPSALTFGHDEDLELRAARQVAGTLGWPLHTWESLGDTAASRRGIDWEHLAGGCSAQGVWEEAQQIGSLAPRFWSGYFLDSLTGGTFFDSCWDAAKQTVTLDKAFRVINHWGIRPDDLAQLLAPLGGRPLVEDVVHKVRQAMQSFPGMDHQRLIQTRINTRFRYHHGAVLWRETFGSWPVLPWLDRHFLETAVDLPLAAVRRRRLERDLLVTRFPDLARVPLDTNSWRFMPVLMDRASWWQRLQSAVPILRRWHAGWRPWPQKSERRRFFRMFDVNGAEWRRLREHAEKSRRRLADWCDPHALNRLLPAAADNFRPKNMIQDTGGMRNLLGLALWAEGH